MELANTLAKSNNYCRKEFIVQPPGGLNFKEFMDTARGIVLVIWMCIPKLHNNNNIFLAFYSIICSEICYSQSTLNNNYFEYLPGKSKKILFHNLNLTIFRKLLRKFFEFAS
jgi:hypothetical protein